MIKNFLFGNLVFLLLRSMYHNLKCILLQQQLYILEDNILLVNLPITRSLYIKTKEEISEGLDQKNLHLIHVLDMLAL